MNDTQRIEKLKLQLAAVDCAPPNPAQKVDLLNELAWLLSDTDLKQAYALSQTAFALANTDPAPYQRGVAYSLRTQGYLNMRFGTYALGLTQLLDALPLVETLQLADALPDVFDGIAAIYCLIGNFPQALDAAYQQLAAAQHISDQRRIINANNNLAVIYYETGDRARSKELLRHNLAIAKAIQHTRITSITYINLAELELSEDDCASAIAHGLHGLQISRTIGYEHFEIHALHTLGQCYHRIADTEQAIGYLEKAVTLSQTLHSKATELAALLTLGEVYRDLQHFEQAEEFIQRAITIAEANNSNKELAQGHLLLAELYEQSGAFAQALVHTKAHYRLKELRFNEKADERLKVLQVAYDTTTAKQEAELAHLRTVTLQEEIAEHERAKSQLQRQLEAMRALSDFKQTLLVPAVGDAERRRILTAALQHLLRPTQARTIALHQNFHDPAFGAYGQLLAMVADPTIESTSARQITEPALAEFRHLLQQQLPALAARPADWVATIFPMVVVPAAVLEQLAAGKWVGGQITDLFAMTPALRDFLLDQQHMHSLLAFPILLDGQWWGTITMTEWSTAARESAVPEPISWTEDEVLLLTTAAEMIAGTWQRWRAETDLWVLNEQLEEQVARRTAELRTTVEQLRTEITERQRAEQALQRLMASLEHRLADRTQELATFLDLTVLGGRSASVQDVMEGALPRILEVTNSRVVCIHLLDGEHQQLRLLAQQELPHPDRVGLQLVPLPPNFHDWLTAPNEPLLTNELAQLHLLPTVFRLADFQSYLGVQIRIGQQIEGLLSCYRFSDRGFSLDDIALVMALGEQLGMVIGSHRLRKQAEEYAVLEERQRLARDLHDSVTQSLYSLSLFSRAGREAIEDGDSARLQRSFAQAESTTLQILREMRLMLYELQPADLAQAGLKQAVELRLNMVERRVGLQVILQWAELHNLPTALEVELYHMIVEGLNNVVKHAAATRLTLQLAQTTDQLYLQLADNGVGFDAAQRTGGMGLRNMRERALRLNGTLTVMSTPQHGTTIEITIPDGMEEEHGTSHSHSHR